MRNETRIVNFRYFVIFGHLLWERGGKRESREKVWPWGVDRRTGQLEEVGGAGRRSGQVRERA